MKKLLKSILTLGLVAVIAVGATVAYFSDTETSTGNRFVAGAIDLTVDNTSHYNGYICQDGLWTCEPWADRVVAFQQGTKKNGDPVDAVRSDPASALGPAETTGAALDPSPDPDDFTSLGFNYNLGLGGILTVSFNNKILNGAGNDLKVFEVTGGSYPDETAKVEVSKDGVTWSDAVPATITRDGEVDLGALDWAQYVRLTDVTDPSPFEPTADGYDVDAVQALHCASEPESLEGEDCSLTWGHPTPQDIDGQKFFEFSDVKPGDSGESTISLHVEDNAAYMCMSFSNLIDDEEDNVEPEQSVGDLSTPQGELSPNMYFMMWHDDGDNIWEANEEVISLPAPASELLNGDTYGLALPASGPVEPGTTSYVGIAWCAGVMTADESIHAITCDVDTMGNDTQTDSMSVDVSFYVEQSRNNGDFSCVPN